MGAADPDDDDMESEDGKCVRVTGPTAKWSSLGSADPSDDDMEGDPEEEHIDVDWVTDLTVFTVAKTSAVMYGNSAQLDFVASGLQTYIRGFSRGPATSILEP